MKVHGQSTSKNMHMLVEMLVGLPKFPNEVSMNDFRYMMFWIVLLTSKLAFSYYVEVSQFHLSSTFCFAVCKETLTLKLRDMRFSNNVTAEF